MSPVAQLLWAIAFVLTLAVGAKYANAANDDLDSKVRLSPPPAFVIEYTRCEGEESVWKVVGFVTPGLAAEMGHRRGWGGMDAVSREHAIQMASAWFVRSRLVFIEEKIECES